MKNIILFFGSFDPLHLGHISIINNSIKVIKADKIYLGLNKSSKKGKLTSLANRNKMLKEYAKTNHKCSVLDFYFDYNNLDSTYQKIFSLKNEAANYYILIGQDQLESLANWYKYDLLIANFNFIIAKRGDIEIDKKYLDNPKYLFIDHHYKNISSSLVRLGKYNYTTKEIKDYILNHNLYLKEQIKPYLSINRYKHSLSVAKTALEINKRANLGLNKYVVEKAALLHDIAKYLDEKKSYKIMHQYYLEYLNEDKKIIHQYLGEYLAKNVFEVTNIEILNAIKYHTSGKENMSLLEKLIYVSDKVEPRRDYPSRNELFETCCKDFDKGFIATLKHNKDYLESKKIKVSNKDTINCFNYYLK